ncbi:MAG: ABC transporter permease DevC [Prochloraceae cyanobacterium]|nr:ABC transporter permease DevC [Prochloraceae cyanobacterium]
MRVNLIKPKIVNNLSKKIKSSKPLAWAQLSHNKVRLAVALTGVAFSNILIFTQLGIRALLFDGVTLIPENLQGELFIMPAYSQTIEFGTFPRIFIYQAAAVAGVSSANPLYINRATWVNPEDLNKSQKERVEANRVKVIAYNPVEPILNLPEVNQQADLLKVPGGVFFDRLSQPKLGPIQELYEKEGKVFTVMDRKGTTVVSLFSLGSTFFDSGHVIMSDWNYMTWKGNNSLQKVSVGVIKIEPNADLETVRERLKQRLSKDVKILTKAELIKAEQDFRASFPSGKILNFGALVGFVVGIIIVYQVLYADVSDHLPEYATLKAMGYSDRALLRVILTEATILAILGFIPGFIASYGVYGLLAGVTKIPLVMRASVALQIFMLTLIMCAISGAIASNKLRSADPADVF